MTELLKKMLGENVSLGRALCLPDGSTRREIILDGVGTQVSVDSYVVLDHLDEGSLPKYVCDLVAKIV